MAFDLQSHCSWTSKTTSYRRFFLPSIYFWETTTNCKWGLQKITFWKRSLACLAGVLPDKKQVLERIWAEQGLVEHCQDWKSKLEDIWLCQKILTWLIPVALTQCHPNAFSLDQSPCISHTRPFFSCLSSPARRCVTWGYFFHARACTQL